MKSIQNVGLTDVQAVYSGPEGKLWELIMGEQIHIGGFYSSMALAQEACIKTGMSGLDLCCCNGAGMRFLVRTLNVKQMTGVDATAYIVEEGIKRVKQEGYADKINFIQADVCDSGLESNYADFVWGQDAWCYVVDKKKLIAEASRIVKPGGIIAFTDWIEGDSELTCDDAERFLNFMKFPNINNISDYSSLLKKNNCEVVTAKDTKLFSPYIDLYLNMLNMQLTYDALKIISFDSNLMQSMAEEMRFMQHLAHKDKIAQGMFIARKQEI
ncbi:MAG: methyltransferase domain-containing protein [Phycisphaerales bacterium]